MPAKPKQVRWVCPEGIHPGVLGPQRPRMDNLCRYCLDCSKEAGKLVQRTAPALEKKREQAAIRAQEKHARNKEKVQAKEDERYLVSGNIDLRKVMKLAWRMQTLGKINGKVSDMPTINLRRTEYRRLKDGRTFSRRAYSGQAFVHQRRITMTITGGSEADAASAIGLILHEMAHIACFLRYEQYHDDDRDFGRRVDNAIEEWNNRYATSYAEVDSRKWGAYKGSIGRKNKRILKAKQSRAASNPDNT